MRLAIIGFTGRAGRLCSKLGEGLEAQGHKCRVFLLPKYAGETDGAFPIVTLEESLGEWTGARFSDSDGIIFLSATGIAVRAIAPFVRDKTSDPAVVVADEWGVHAIPLLSGHIGGANELALLIAGLLGARPVITTATDLNGCFAVDVFAAQNDLWISDMERAKAISSALLQEEEVGYFDDFITVGKPEQDGDGTHEDKWEMLRELPPGLRYGKYCRENIWITVQDKSGEKQFHDRGMFVLRLVPKAVTLGVGCRRGTSVKTLEQQIKAALCTAGVEEHSVECLASIHRKRDEEGIMNLCERWKLPFETFSGEELETLPGEFTESAFVRETVGIGNICERAALAAAGKKGNADLIIRKKSGEGVTAAAALRQWKANI